MKCLKMKLAKMMLLFAALLMALSGCMQQTEPQPAQIHPLPALAAAQTEPEHDAFPAEAQNTQPEAEAEPSLSAVEELSFDETQMLTIQTEQGELSLCMHAYLLGVLYAELPQDFSLEAMKAQAVASRTFALRKLEAGKQLCDDPACCQAYLDPTGAQLERAEQAICETDGQVLVYQGELIEATFFSCSGGMTEAAVEVWGNEVDYLQAVESPGEESAPRYSETVTFPMAAFREMILSVCPEADFQQEPLVGAVERTEGGGVRTIEIAGAVFTGVQLRQLLSLRSTNFSVEWTETSVRITTQGYGHRVGMSQYGAEAMARQGKSYTEILAHYYQGTEIKNQS